MSNVDDMISNVKSMKECFGCEEDDCENCAYFVTYEQMDEIVEGLIELKSFKAAMEDDGK